MRIVILANSGSVHTAGWHARDLARGAAARGHAIEVCSWKRLVGRAGCGGPIAADGQVVLDDANAVVLRTMPPGSLEQIVFRMDLLGRLADNGVVVVNHPRAIEGAVDKYLALVRMQAAGLPVPPTIVCQQHADAADAFRQLGQDVVIKPLFGSEGFGMMRVHDAALADRAFATLARLNSVLYVQKFIEHNGCDHRLFILGGRILASMLRCGDGFRTNIAQGGVGRTTKPDDQLCDLAVRAAAACGAQVAGVDIVMDNRGSPFVLEVNAVPGWRALAKATGVDVATRIIEWLEGRVGGEDGS